MKRRDFVKFALATGGVLAVSPAAVLAQGGGGGRFTYVSGTRRLEGAIVGDPLSGSFSIKWQSGKKAGTARLRSNPKAYQQVAEAFAEAKAISLAANGKTGRIMARDDLKSADMNFGGESGQVSTYVAPAIAIGIAGGAAFLAGVVIGAGVAAIGIAVNENSSVKVKVSAPGGLAAEVEVNNDGNDGDGDR